MAFSRGEVERVEEAEFHGWVVSYREEGRERTCRFSDDEYGSADRAHRAAVWFANLRPGSPWPGGARGTTGVTGVVGNTALTTSGRRVGHYQAYWYSWKGKRGSRTFSWLKYGKEEALRRAALAVKRGVEEAAGIRSSREGRARAPALRLGRRAPMPGARRGTRTSSVSIILAFTASSYRPNGRVHAVWDT
jgi:hypothetical protein